MNMKKYHQIYYLKISSNLLFENIIKFVFFAILVAFICDGGAGREGCGRGSSAAAGMTGRDAMGQGQGVRAGKPVGAHES